jgi:DNA-binding response OmpR family regulator
MFDDWKIISMPKKILVADDDPSIVDSLTMILEEEGYNVQTALKNHDTLSTVKDLKPDLVLLDIWIDNEDGREICQSLKRDILTNKIPIVVISASQGAAQMAIDAGADDFIAKPFEIDELISKIQKNLN